MTTADGHADASDGLAREAAHWFARMRGPGAEADRAAFEAWLAQGPEHRTAYNRSAEIFAMGKLLAEPAGRVAAPARRGKMLAAALAAAAAGAIAIGGWAVSHRSAPSGSSAATAETADRRTFSTNPSKARAVRLADGSTVRLDGDTLLEVYLSGAQRDLKLLRGQARFEVAHEKRPFVVFAGGGSVTARGTIFEVALSRSGKVDVRLLQGAVDVALPRARATAPPAIRKLAPGQGVSFAAKAPAPPPATAPGEAAGRPVAAAREFEATPVSELVDLANRGAARPIRLGDASLAARRVSGWFRVDDTELLARRLSTLFDGEVDTRDPREIVLVAAGGGAHATNGRRAQANAGNGASREAGRQAQRPI